MSKQSALVLGELPLFSGIPAADVGSIQSLIRFHDYRDGEVIFSRGDPGEQAFIIATGLVRISTLGENGKRVTVEIFKHGDMFGELATLDRRARTADANAIGPTKVAAIPADCVRALLTASPAFAVNLLRLLTERLRRTYSLLEDASLSDLERRLAKQVLYLMTLGSAGEHQVKLYSRMRQSDLADLLGATPRSIINILNKWRSEALAEFDGRTAQITILDLQRFRELAERDKV